MTPDQASLAAILAEIDRSGMPRTPKDYARLAARTAMIAIGPPDTDKAFIDAASGLAEGILCDVWSKLPEWERWTWIDLCEEAIREAAAEHARAPP